MKKTLLLIALGALATTATAQTEMGELPLDTQFTINKGEVYTFTPSGDGVLSIEFEGTYPDQSIMWSDCYNANFNPYMEYLPYQAANPDPIWGQKSPVKFEIFKYQPAASGSSDLVKYDLVGPDQTDIFNPANSITSMTITATFTPKGEDDVLAPTAYPEPGGYFDFNTVGNLEIRFEPATLSVTCGSIKIDMYKGDTWLKSISGADREITWEYNLPGGYYYLNLMNLFLYELEGTQVDNFTITLSDFNYELAGDIVNEEGAIEVNYLFDEWYGVITFVSATEWPTYICPTGANPATVTLTYSGDLGRSTMGEVVVLGTDLGEINQEASPKTNTYSVDYTIDGPNLTINFDSYRQTGPVDDNGQLIKVDGYVSSSSVMSVIVRNMVGADGSQVQPILEHINWVAEAPEGNAVSAVDAENHWTVYSTQGILLLDTDNHAAVNALPAGFYIINGKKVVK